MQDVKVQYQAVADLKPRPRNARTHSKQQIRQIAESIRTFGFNNPVLVDVDGMILAGHGRVEAAKLLGMETVPTIRLGEMTEEQKRAYVLADNRLAELAGWDKELLAFDLQELTTFDLDFDLTTTGFETPEIDILIDGLESKDKDPVENIFPDTDPFVSPVTQLNDLWILGLNRLLCGDATKPTTFTQLMGGMKAQMVFVDPPYNVPIDGHVCGSGSIRHNEFPMASGEMSEAEFTEFLQACLFNLADHSTNGSIHFVCIDWRHIAELITAARGVYTEVKNLCVWNKDNGGMGALYRSKHELVFVLKNGSAQHINNIQLGRYGRNRTNVWNYPGVNSLRAGRLDELRMHPTVKPVELISDAVKDCSKRGGIVLDSFVGSGTTIIAAEKTGRMCYAVELDPRYVDTAIQRWEKFTGKKATLAETGQIFSEVKRSRSRKRRSRPRLRLSENSGEDSDGR